MILKRNLTSLVICIAIILSLANFNFTVSADSNFSGSGTEADPFLISTASDLVTLSSLTNANATAATYVNKYYQLTNDIDMSGVANFMPICYAFDDYKTVSNSGADSTKRFHGTFDGNGYIIKNVTIDLADSTIFTDQSKVKVTAGIFGVLGHVPNSSPATGAVIKNLGVENIIVNIAGKSNPNVGGIAGTVMNQPTITNCYVRGMTVSGNPSATVRCGGIVGYIASDAKSTHTYNYATGLTFNQSDLSNTGGIYGMGSGKSGITITSCYTNYSKFKGSGGANFTTSKIYDATSIGAATPANLGNTYFKADQAEKNSGHPILSWEEIFNGRGTETAPYLLSTAANLIALSSLTNSSATILTYCDKYYQLTNDIDMSGVANFKPICYSANSSYQPVSGNSLSRFHGTFDGNGHIIKNVTIDLTDTSTFTGSNYMTAGIFGVLGHIDASLKTGAIIKNLGVENMTVTAADYTNVNIGGIAGNVQNFPTIQDSYVRGMTVNGTTTKEVFCGGIVGQIGSGEASTYKNCYATGLSFSLTNTNSLGGMYGKSSSNKKSINTTSCYTNYSKFGGSGGSGNTTSNIYDATSIGAATPANLGTEYFKTDPYNKNDGRPLLIWEKDIDATLTFTESTGTLTASASITNYIGSTRNFNLIIAKYNGVGENELKRISSASITAAATGTTEDTVTMSKDENTVYKAFLLYGSEFFPVVVSQKQDFTE